MTCSAFFPKEIEGTPVSRKILVPTCGDSVVSSSTEADLSNTSGCTQEEADTRVFRHVADCVKQGHKKTIRTADTDVVLAICVVEEIKVEELWVAFGTGEHFRYINWNPRDCFKSWCRQIKSFACLSHCN